MRQTLYSTLICLSLLSACTDDEPAAGPIEGLKATETLTDLGAPGALRIVVDDHGIRHVYGEGKETMMFGQGYVTARDRFWQMDIMRRFATGRLSGLFGDLALENDIEMRGAMLTRDGELLEIALANKLESEQPEIYGQAQAYADGVNAWLRDLREERNGATLPLEYDFALLSKDPEDLVEWTVADSLAIGRLQSWFLSISHQAEADQLALRQLLGDELYTDVYRFQPPAPAITLDEGTQSAAAYQPQAAHVTAHLPRPKVSTDLLQAMVSAARRRSALNPMARDDAGGIGSNDWIVAPSLSASGHALLANDPHLDFMNPPVWHVVHLDPNYKTDLGLPAAQGVSFPGLPGIILGYNNYVAWGGTVAGYDVADVYIETVNTPDDYPASPRTVLYKGEQVPVKQVKLDFELNNGDIRTETIEIVPHHGPMMPDPDVDDDRTGLAATNMSFRWTGHEITLDAVFIVSIMQATSVQAAKDALDYFAVGAQNWVLADIEGNIGYKPYALVPVRPEGVEPYLPVTGTGEAEWLTKSDGTPVWLTAEELPHADNPAKGFIATANTDLRGELQDNDPLNDAHYLYWDRANAFRLERIHEMMAEYGADKISMEDMGRMQYDYTSKEAEYILPYLIAAMDGTSSVERSSAMTDALDRLKSWGTGTTPYFTHAGLDPADKRDDMGEAAEITADDKADAAATTIFYAFLARLAHNTLGDELAVLEGTDLENSWRWDIASRSLVHLLTHEGATGGSVLNLAAADGSSALWDNVATTTVTESRDDILLTSFAQGLADMEAWFESDDQAGWLWGELHPLVLDHALAEAGTDQYSFGANYDIGHSGTRESVSPADFPLQAPLVEPGEYLVTSYGASKRFIVEMNPDGPKGFNIIPGGEAGAPADEEYDHADPAAHYNHWVADWERGTRFEYRFTPDEVATNATAVWDVQ